jgi:hypothetical protein
LEALVNAIKTEASGGGDDNQEEEGNEPDEDDPDFSDSQLQSSHQADSQVSRSDSSEFATPIKDNSSCMRAKVDVGSNDLVIAKE